jgi:hypothetical protein
MSKKTIRVLLYLSLGLIAFTINSCLLSKFVPKDPPTTDNQITSAITNIEFPLESVEYPQNWPEDLKLPDGIILVDSKSGLAPEGDRQGWLGKFRFTGDPSEAERLISIHFSESGWKTRRIGEFASGGFVLLLEKDQSDGLVVVDIDPEDPSQVIIAVSCFP